MTAMPSWANDAPTDRQKNLATAFGGDPLVFDLMSKYQLSQYIDAMKHVGRTVDWSRCRQRVITPVGPPAQLAAQPPVSQPEPEVSPVTNNVPPPFPLALFERLRNGYYAYQLDETEPLTFMRVIERKTGRLKGCRVLSTQHGSDFIDRFVLYPSGKWYASDLTIGTNGLTLTDLVMGVLADQRGCALRYAHEKGSCCRCNKELTVDRSRWYAIGPDCEQLPGWNSFIDDMDNELGFTFDERENYPESSWPEHFRNYLQREAEAMM